MQQKRHLGNSKSGSSSQSSGVRSVSPKGLDEIKPANSKRSPEVNRTKRTPKTLVEDDSSTPDSTPASSVKEDSIIEIDTEHSRSALKRDPAQISLLSVLQDEKCLNGEWEGDGKKRVIIKNQHVYFGHNKNKEYRLFQDVEKVELMLKDKIHHGIIEDVAQRINWDDGDTWIKIKKNVTFDDSISDNDALTSSTSAMSTTMEKEFEDGSKVNKKVRFDPGRLGIEYKIDTGQILKIGAYSQAMQNEIEMDWIIKTINEKPYTHELLQETKNGDERFSMGFFMPKKKTDSDPNKSELFEALNPQKNSWISFTHSPTLISLDELLMLSLSLFDHISDLIVIIVFLSSHSVVLSFLSCLSFVTSVLLPVYFLQNFKLRIMSAIGCGILGFTWALHESPEVEFKLHMSCWIRNRLFEFKNKLLNLKETEKKKEYLQTLTDNYNEILRCGSAQKIFATFL